MKKKLILMSALIIALSSFTGCGSSGTSTTEKKIEEKLPLTKENLTSVFSEYEYNVFAEINEEAKSIQADFIKKNDVERGKEKEELAKIEDILHERFDINEDDTHNNINCKYDYKIIVCRNFDKIAVREKPVIHVENKGQYYTYVEYKLNNKFDILNPYKDLKVTANDEEDGDLTSKIKIKNPEILNDVGEKKKLIYEVTDSDGNTATEKFSVDVIK
ncbi:hypothetical protein NNC19_21790 [Clostridium sp. SHJSY1]|uniref:hypothetical protein n=1 Tax=Clostridium sp. SHJSY1 TaxID=2942483 RepID=UPI0028751137|nr:hypothetical protein [Clostridium sp. SHJSY1]MDS0528323.1 hypothetical protein [Clostridium sp. SHJSY1]